MNLWSVKTKTFNLSKRYNH